MTNIAKQPKLAPPLARPRGPGPLGFGSRECLEAQGGPEHAAPNIFAVKKLSCKMHRGRAAKSDMAEAN